MSNPGDKRTEPGQARYVRAAGDHFVLRWACRCRRHRILLGRCIDCGGVLLTLDERAAASE